MKRRALGTAGGEEWIEKTLFRKMTVKALRRWKTVGLIALAVMALTIPLYLLKGYLTREGTRSSGKPAATFVGRSKCAPCHREAYRKWLGSDHDRSMSVANENTVLGDFNDAVFESGGVTSRFFRRNGKYVVRTAGPDGKMADFQIAYTVGVEPLQQYLIPFPGGRLQALSIVWDVERGRWFHLYPNEDIPPRDWLHWTRGGQNWNGMCAECHSTNLQKGYDPASRTFHTTWSEIDVSCEACHGPGSRHVAWAEMPPMARQEADNVDLVIPTSRIRSRQQVELCAPCHSRRTELGDYQHTKDALMQTLVPSLLEEGLYYPDGQILDEVYVYGSFAQSKMFVNDVRCGDCHDVHSLKLVKEGNALCLQCHGADAYDTEGHHFHKKTYQGRPNEGARCVKCHMPERAYMVIDERADHSFRVPRPDLTREIGTPNACAQSGCHDDKPLEWLLRAFETWYPRAKKTHYGTTLAAGREGRPEAEEALIGLAGDKLYPAIVRATALSLLGSYPEEESVEAFQAALLDEEPLVRYAAVEHVVVPTPERLVALVGPLLFDPARAVRLKAATRLAGAPAELLGPSQKEALDKNLAEYERAMEYSLDFSFAGYNLGNLCSRLGDQHKAEAYYKEAIAIDDLFYPAKANLAILYNSMGKNQEAETLLREILRDYPDMYDTAYTLGLLLSEMERYPEAADYLSQASRGMPDSSRVHYNLGLTLQYLGRSAEAEAALKKALGVEPDNLEYLHALAEHYIRQGRLRKALAIAETMVARHPHDPTGRELKASIEKALKAGPARQR